MGKKHQETFHQKDNTWQISPGTDQYLTISY